MRRRKKDVRYELGLIGRKTGNIVIIGVLIAGVVGYSAYRQKNQPGGVAAGKKRA